MALYEISFLLGHHGAQDSEIIEASSEEWAEITFEHHFPKRAKYVFAVDEFHHVPNRHIPLEEMTIYRNPYPQLEEIDWTHITTEDVSSAVSQSMAEVLL